MSTDGLATVGVGATAWTTGRIVSKDLPAPHLVRLRLDVEDRQRHWPGQHYLVRLRDPDDYTAQRSYSQTSQALPPVTSSSGRLVV